MTLTVAPGDPDAAADLLRASHTLMNALFPAESNHYLSLDALKAPNIHFLIACDADDPPLGCAALSVQPEYGEVKSMFVAEAARGRGIGDALLARIEAVARANGVALLRLETGTLLHAAHRLYARHGFVERGPFGDYAEDPNSLFMEKPL